MPLESAQLEAALAPVLGDAVDVEGLARLSGGASRETWSFDATVGDGVRQGLVLRRDPPKRPGLPGAMGLEARSLQAASRAGLRVPAVLVVDESGDQFGSAGLVMERVAGETIARRILRDDEYGKARAALSAQCGEFLAGLHAIPLEEVSGLSDDDPLTVCRLWYDQLGQTSAVFELAFCWLEKHRPAAVEPTIVHGDFRLGNFIVDAEGLQAVLDWELVHQGDPLEDLGWLCTKAWRFGSDKPVGGLGDYDELIEAYETAGGRPVDRDALRWWEVLGSLRWGVICMGQALAHLSGMHRSVELAAIGRRVCEQEWDLLTYLTDRSGSGPGYGRSSAHSQGQNQMYGQPTAVELLEAVGEFLEGDVREGTTGRVHFHSLVARKVVAMVAREIELGPDQRQRYTGGLARLGVSDEADLAEAIRRGEFEQRRPDLDAFLLQTVADRLAVANPDHDVRLTIE